MESDKAEVLRYLGHKGQEISPELDIMVEECMQSMREAARRLSARETFDIRLKADGIHLENTGLILRGEDICRHLSECSRVVLLAATLGIAADKLIRRWEAADITRSLVLDACATQYIEQYCDELEEEIKREMKETGLEAAPRFSPGYGDLPLDIQPKLLSVLDTGRKIGLTCTENFIMIPRKSVTAVIGLGKNLYEMKSGCEGCTLSHTCDFTRGKGDCGYTGADSK